VLITKHGEVADGEYQDPKGNQTIKYDHIKQTVVGQGAFKPLDASVETLRSAVEKEMFEYATSHYPHGACAVYGRDGKVIVCLSSARFNSSNFWNGRWRSTWTLSGDGTVNGQIKIVVHYYEDGNVQLNTDTKFSVKVDKAAPAEMAKAVAKQISATDQKFHTALDTSYSTMGDTTFKALRRALPITRTKIDWNRIKNYKIGK